MFSYNTFHLGPAVYANLNKPADILIHIIYKTEIATNLMPAPNPFLVPRKNSSASRYKRFDALRDAGLDNICIITFTWTLYYPFAHSLRAKSNL